MYLSISDISEADILAMLYFVLLLFCSLGDLICHIVGNKNLVKTLSLLPLDSVGFQQ